MLEEINANPFYDDDDETEDDGRGGEESFRSDAPGYRSGVDGYRSDVDDGDAETIRVAIDWVEFEGALENNSPELKSYLNIVSGDVIRVFEGSDKKKEITPDNDKEYLLIDPISSREQYHWMEEFIEGVEEAALKDKLNIAIDGKGAFRRFKDVLMAYPTERERWFAQRSVKLHAHMQEWMKSKHVEAGNIPPWVEGYDQNRRFEDKKGRSDGEARAGWRDGQTDLRAVSHDLLDLIPSRELPTAVAFLEFLRGRRGFRRPNHP
jgi:hypothetical protein